MKNPTEFTVHRASWSRGEDPPALHDPKTDTFCVLGFIARQCGITKKELAGLTHLHQLRTESQAKLPRALRPKDDDENPCASEGAGINDDTNLGPDERERRLREWARKLNIALLFRGGGTRR